MKEKEINTKICTFFKISQGLSYDCVSFIDGMVVFTVWLVSEFEAFLYLKHYTFFFLGFLFVCFFNDIFLKNTETFLC